MSQMQNLSRDMIIKNQETVMEYFCKEEMILLTVGVEIKLIILMIFGVGSQTITITT